MTGVRFEPDGMLVTADRLDIRRTEVENDVRRITSAPRPSMPPHVAAAVEFELGLVAQNAGPTSAIMASVIAELRSRAALATAAARERPTAAPAGRRRSSSTMRLERASTSHRGCSSCRTGRC